MKLPYLILALALGRGTSSACLDNNCARAVTGTRTGNMPDITSRRADCSSFMAVTVTPAASTITTTSTVTTTTTLAGMMKREDAILEKRQTAVSPSSLRVPTYASACSGTAGYSSACSCWGITARTATASIPVTRTTVTVTVTATASVSTIPVNPGNCSTYSASCSSVVNSILASNSIASPELVDLRIQSAILGITNLTDFLAVLGPDPCQTYTDPTEHGTCVALLANSDFVTELTKIAQGLLSPYQTCASNFAAGVPDYQIIFNDPNNATCTGRTAKRRIGVKGEYDMTQGMLEHLEYSRSIMDEFERGPMKSSALQLTRKQLSTCSRTGQCFQTCPDCRLQQTYCGTASAVISGALCTTLGIFANGATRFVSGAACGAACAELKPLAAGCAVFCGNVAGPLVGAAVGGACLLPRQALCNPIAQRCSNCNSFNGGICDSNSSQCCPGETGTRCGTDCCCCPACQAPGGINCECTAAPC